MVDHKKSPQKKRNITSTIASELTQRAKSEAESQRTSLRTGLRSKIETLLPQQLRWLLPLIEGNQPADELTEADVEPPSQPTDAPLDTISTVHSVETLYRQYRCWNGDPLGCHFPQQTVQQNPTASACLECGFPVVLAEKSEIRGSRGRYRIDRWLKRRGTGRLYQGTQLSDGQPVVIKEYVLPTRSFGASEIRQRKVAFTRVAGVAAVDGRIQDYRLLTPWEAIADQTLERCYLVTKGSLDTSPTLGNYLVRCGAMTDLQVRHVLNQVLQTLEFLHGQKSRLPGGQVQLGVAHGNLSLESLLIVEGRGRRDREQGTGDRGRADTDFFVYVCDLALWESLFELSTATPRQSSWQQDLIDLGYVAFYLLVGQMRTAGAQQLIDPRDDQAWRGVHSGLQRFILRLMQIDTPFESAEAARQALLKLPIDLPRPSEITAIQPEVEEPINRPRILWWLYGLVGLMAVIWLVAWLWPKSQPAIVAEKTPLLCRIRQVAGVPNGQFTYSAEAGGTWGNLLLQRDVVSAAASSPVGQATCRDALRLADASASGRTIVQAMQSQQPKLKLTYVPEATFEQAIAGVRAGQRDFAITSVTDDLPVDLARREFAYDGLAVFVPFSYARRDNSLPKHLKGHITLEQLQQLYTGRIKNWKQLGGPNLDVRLYAPIESETLRLFEKRVLKTDQNIAQFRSLLTKNEIHTPEQIRQLPTLEMLRAVIQSFEDDLTDSNQIGAIAFGTLSNGFGQCSVYPLAIAAEGMPPVQALVQDNGRAIDPTTDLCRNKGSYRPDVEQFKTQRYPLAYSLAVVYPHDNSRPPVGEKFADMLRTQEGQRLLQQTGLVPLEEF